MVNPDAVRGQVLLEESREAVVVLDEDGVVRRRQPARAAVARHPRGRRAEPRAAAGRAGARRSLRRRRDARSGSSTSRRPATSPPTRSCAPASPRPSRTSCGRRSPACSRCSSSRAFPARTCLSSSSSRAREIDQIRELIDEVLFLAELESGTRVVSLGAEPVLPVLHEVVAELEEQAARAGVTLLVEGDADATAEVRPRMLARRRQEPRRERDPLRRPGRQRDALRRARGRRGGASRRRRRRRRRRGRSPAAVRALLPRRPLPRLARHRARPGDREARRHLRRRHGRGPRRSRARARDPLLVPHPA